MAANPADIVKRLEQLKAQRIRHENVWRDCFDHSYPIRGSGFTGDVYDAARAQMKRANLVDDTATDACNILASSVVGGLTPASLLWLEYDVDGETPEDEQWLSEASRTVWENIHASNFDATNLEAAQDDVGAGWSVLYVDEDEEGGFRFEQWPLAECYVTAITRGGRVDTIYREFELSAAQAMDLYEGRVSSQTRALAREKPDEKVCFVHAIYPRLDWMDGAQYARNLPFASCHVEVKQKLIVRESGYHEFPCVVPRWRLIPGTHYAIGPMSDALPTTRRLNEICRMEISALDLAVAGMWIAENDGVLNPRTVKVGPRKIIVANSVDSMKPLLTGSDFSVSFAKAEEMRAQIRKILMADQLQPQDGPAMTATEVHARMALIRQLLGPHYGRYTAEKLKPLAERCFGLALRAGVLGRPPDSLVNKVLQVQYRGPLARAQRLEDVSAMDHFEATLLAQAQGTQSTDPLDIYDWDEARRERADLLGVPQKLIRKPEELEREREDKRKAMQAQQQQQVMKEAGTAMIDASAQRMAKAA